MLSRLDPIECAAACALLNAIAKPVLAWAVYGADAPNAVSFLCASAGVAIWARHRRCYDLKTWQWAGLAIAVAGMLLPVAFAAWGAVALIALLLLARADQARLEKAGLIVLLAAAIRTPLAEGAMILLAEPLLLFDGAFANLVGGLIGGGGALNGNMIVGAEGHAVLVMSGCASFSNVSNALLIWFTVAMLAADAPRRHLIAMAVGLTAAIVTINAGRLGGMTLSRDSYHWIHDGNGALIAEMAMTLAILGALALTLGRYRHA